MAKKPYVEVCFEDSDRSSPDPSYYPVIVIGKRRFAPSFDEDCRGSYEKKEQAFKVAQRIASQLGIEVKL